MNKHGRSMNEHAGVDDEPSHAIGHGGGVNQDGGANEDGVDLDFLFDVDILCTS